MRRRLVAATLATAGLGAALGRPSVVLVALVPAAVLAAGAVAGPPRPSVTASRELSTGSPELGERVRVRVTVANDGDAVADCLLEDELPAGIEAVAEPSRSVRLPAGETAVLEYAVVARRGSHEFGDVGVTARGLLEERRVEVPVETTLACRPGNRPLELRATAPRRVEGAPGETGGSGVEFHSVREYHPSDPQRRVDWRRFARTRDLSTVEFREDSTETVHLLVDARPACAVRATPAAPSAVAYCADAAERIADALAARGTRVGLGLYPDVPVALSPGSGPGHRAEMRRLLAGHGAFPWGDDGRPVASEAAVADGGLPDSLDGRARILLVSPCLDDDPVEFVATAVGAGEDVGLLAPDVGGATPGATVERALRAGRLSRLDGLDVPLADWDVEAPLELAVEEVFATWA